MSEEVERGVRLENPGYVYIFESHGILKIGQSVNPDERLGSLNRSYYCGRDDWEFVEKYKSNWMLQVEQFVHMELIDYKIRNETFNCSLDLAKKTIISSVNMFKSRYQD